MIKASINLQDLRRKIYRKAKTEPTNRFWGMYVHVVKVETLKEAYFLSKRNKGTPGIDGVTFEEIESSGLEAFLTDLREELLDGKYRPLRNREVEIPKDNGKTRQLSIPSIKDRVVQGALKLVLEAVFEADFQSGSYGYRPKRIAQQATNQVAESIVKRKTRVIDIDLKNYFGTVRHDILLKKIAKRIDDKEIMSLLKLILKASGKRGLPQGGPLSPLLSNLYLNEVDKMLERAKEVTSEGQYTHIEYVRWADDIVILIDEHKRWDWLLRAVKIRLKQELAKLDVELNEEKTRIVYVNKGDIFSFLGFEFRQCKTRRGKLGVYYQPTMKARTKLLKKLKDIFRRYRSQPINLVIEQINPILRGWVNYFRSGNSSRCFCYIRDWLEKKIRRHLMRSMKRKGFGWNRWSRKWFYESLGLYSDYKIIRYDQNPKACPVR